MSYYLNFKVTSYILKLQKLGIINSGLRPKYVHCKKKVTCIIIKTTIRVLLQPFFGRFGLKMLSLNSSFLVSCGILVAALIVF